ncbi:MAG: hypothetical protein ACOYT7_00505 [Patescibacteria group bacterium]
MAKTTSKKVRKVKPFNIREFIKLAKELRTAVKKEEKKYGPLVSTP